MKKIIKFGPVFIIFFGIISFVYFKAMARLGEFSTIIPRFDGKCEIALSQSQGIEDFALIENSENKNILIYAALNREEFRKNKNIRGAIHASPIDNFTQSNDKSLGVPKNFQPVGIGVLKGQTNILMAINNADGKSIVEIFHIDNDFNAHHVQSVEINGAKRLNDVVPLSENSFYVTNESKYENNSFLNIVMNFLNLDKTGAIYYYDGKTEKKLYEGLSFANSIALSNDGKKLYATGTLSRNLLIFDRNNQNNEIKLSDEVFLGTGADNINIDNENRLFIAAHPKIFTLIKKMWFGGENTPSQVIVIEPSQNGKGGNIDQVYIDKGSAEFGETSSAVKIDNKLIMGSIYSKGLKVCELPKIWHHSKSHPAQRLIDTQRDAQIKKAQKELLKGGAAK